MKTYVPSAGTTLLQFLRRRWCHHRRTTITPRTDMMPAHTVCLTCGWREPVDATSPVATRTWDSTRDEARYEREKQRRARVELQRTQVIRELARPLPKMGKTRRQRSNVIDINRAMSE